MFYNDLIISLFGSLEFIIMFKKLTSGYKTLFITIDNKKIINRKSKMLLINRREVLHRVPRMNFISGLRVMDTLHNHADKTELHNFSEPKIMKLDFPKTSPLAQHFRVLT